jgi:putative aldouronate transport system substrate-binding protein
MNTNLVKVLLIFTIFALVFVTACSSKQDEPAVTQTPNVALEQAEAEKKAAEEAAAKAEAEAAAAKAEAEKAAAEKAAAEQALAEAKTAEEKAAAEKALAEKVAAEKVAKEAADAAAKVAAEKAAAEKAATEKAAAEKAAADKAAADKAAADKAVKAPATISKTGFPITSKPITLTAFTGRHPFQQDWNNMPIFKKVSQDTNVTVVFNNNLDSVLAEKLNLLFATSASELPEMIIRSRPTDIQINQWAQNGLIIDLAPYLNDYAPNLTKLMNENPSIRKAITSPDGKIYSMPNINRIFSLRQNVVWINKQWLDKLGLPVPKTTDELFNTLMAFKTKNPSGLDGTVGLHDFSNSYSRIILHFAGAFELGNKGTSFFSDGVDFGPDLRMKFFKIDPNYRVLLQYLNKLYENGLLNPEIVGQPSGAWLTKLQAGKVGAYLLQGAGDAPKNADGSNNYVPTGPLLGPTGKAMQSQFGPSVTRGAGLITKNNKNIEASIRWMDQWYSAEGFELLDWGIEGQQWKRNDNKEAVRLITDAERGNWSPSYGGFDLWHRPLDYFEKYDPVAFADKQQYKAALLYKDVLPKYSVETFTFTNEELTVINKFKTEVIPYITEMETKFITGRESFDNWFTFANKVKSSGLDAYLEAYNKALARSQK